MNESPETSQTILVIDDEVQMRRLLRACLELEGYVVVEAATGDQGLREAVRCRPDAILLDLGLPDIDGQAVLQRLREWSQVPVIVLSVRSLDEDKISALDHGANDYVTKPFSTGELLARLRAAQRSVHPPAPPETFKTGRLQVDLVTRTVRVAGRQVRLSLTEYSLLSLLVRHAGRILTHGQILREVWKTGDSEKTGSLRVYVNYLRDKIETNPAEPELLLTEPGIGYRLAIRD